MADLSLTQGSNENGKRKLSHTPTAAPLGTNDKLGVLVVSPELELPSEFMDEVAAETVSANIDGIPDENPSLSSPTKRQKADRLIDAIKEVVFLGYDGDTNKDTSTGNGGVASEDLHSKAESQEIEAATSRHDVTSAVVPEQTERQPEYNKKSRIGRRAAVLIQALKDPKCKCSQLHFQLATAA